MAVNSLVYDIGISTHKAIMALKQGITPELAGLQDEYSNGNGSLMRVLPVVLWHKGSDTELMMLAQRQSIVTHGHLRSQICCAIYCLLARYILQAHSDPWSDTLNKAYDVYKHDDASWKELNTFIIPALNNEPKGSGYVVDSLCAVKRALQMSDYQQAVRYAISLGGDTDTTACLVGGIIGLRDGLTGIPQHWKEQLRGRSLYEPLLAKLMIHLNSDVR